MKTGRYSGNNIIPRIKAFKSTIICLVPCLSLLIWEPSLRLIQEPIENHQYIIENAHTQMLCISTSERVLPMPFAGQNHLFLRQNNFSPGVNQLLGINQQLRVMPKR